MMNNYAQAFWQQEDHTQVLAVFVILLSIFALTLAPIRAHSRSLPLTPAHSRSLPLTSAHSRSLPRLSMLSSACADANISTEE